MKKILNYADIISVIKKISDKRLSIIYHHLDQSYKKTTYPFDIQNIALLNVRTISPPKIFFFRVLDVLSCEPKNYEKTLLIDVKYCDLKAMRVLDNMFLKDYVDDRYKNYRDNFLIISSDCINPQPTCFCSIVGARPYVERDDGSDINISFIDENNLILESFTQKGEEFLRDNFNDFDEPTRNDFLKRDSIRTIAERKIKELNREYVTENKKDKYYLTLKNTYQLDKIWKEESEKCVQCGGCNFICPSCYCFLIREASKSYKEQYRDKVWDVCHFTGYARVAGGANPRKYKYQRFRNRYQCKFVYRYENFGFYACSGCGRCIEVCPAKIDMRKVVRNLVLSKGEQVLT